MTLFDLAFRLLHCEDFFFRQDYLTSGEMGTETFICKVYVVETANLAFFSFS